MTRLFCVMMVLAVAGLLAAPAWAAVPYPDNCHFQWINPIKGATNDTVGVGVCFKADYSGIKVIVHDQFDSAMPGENVTVTFSNANVFMHNPAVGLTDASGLATIMFDYSTNNAGPIALLSNITVTCRTVPLHVYTGLYVISPDYNKDFKVNIVDNGTFGDDWHVTQAGNHSNFAWANPFVDITDAGIFAGHYNAAHR